MQMKKKVTRLLASLARRRLTDIPTVGITGSIGKTTAKDALAHILRTQHQRIIATKKSMNSEIGLPLTLLELPASRGKLDFLWLLPAAFFRSLTRLSANALVLEYGVDKPGDMQELLTICTPSIGIFTAHASVHIGEANFPDQATLLADEGLLITSLPTDGTAILNSDDVAVMSLLAVARVRTFGTTEHADLRILSTAPVPGGMDLTLSYEGVRTAVTVPFYGTHLAYSLAAAVLGAVTLGIPFEDAVAPLSTFHLPPGRGGSFAGIRGSTLIDSTYNSSPASASAALTMLSELPGRRRIAVLGQMNELGPLSEKAHRELGALARKHADLIIGVYGQAALFDPDHFFASAEEAGAYLQKELRAGDTVLFKGSQNNVRLERAVRLILADHKDLQYLPRQ